MESLLQNFYFCGLLFAALLDKLAWKNMKIRMLSCKVRDEKNRVAESTRKVLRYMDNPRISIKHLSLWEAAEGHKDEQNLERMMCSALESFRLFCQLVKHRGQF